MRSACRCVNANCCCRVCVVRVIRPMSRSSSSYATVRRGYFVFFSSRSRARSGPRCRGVGCRAARRFPASAPAPDSMVWPDCKLTSEISAGDMLSVLHMDGADRALPGRAQANHAGGRLQVSRREFHARECAPRDEDASAREDHGENRDHQGCMARRMRQQPAKIENFPVALRTCGRNSGGLTAAAASSLDAVMTGPIPANAQS